MSRRKCIIYVLFSFTCLFLCYDIIIIITLHKLEPTYIQSAGKLGAPYSIPSQSHQDLRKQMEIFKFNKRASDEISVKRTIPDYRHSKCLEMTFETLPKASIIIHFNNEALSVLLRTIWSVLLNTNQKLLEEIILVDDGSISNEILVSLPKYIEHNFPSKVILIKVSQGGKIGMSNARLIGAKKASGDVLVFLNSNMEVNYQWLEPLINVVHTARHKMPIMEI